METPRTQEQRLDDTMNFVGDVYTAVLKWQDTESVAGMLEAYYDDKPQELVELTRMMIGLCQERGVQVMDLCDELRMANRLFGPKVIAQTLDLALGVRVANEVLTELSRRDLTSDKIG